MSLPDSSHHDDTPVTSINIRRASLYIYGKRKYHFVGDDEATRSYSRQELSANAYYSQVEVMSLRILRKSVIYLHRL